MSDSDGNPKGGNEVPSRSDDSAGRQASPNLSQGDTNMRTLDVLERLIDKIDVQAKCLEGYAEQNGYSGKAPASVFHWQAAHFRDIAAEIRPHIEALTEQVTEARTAIRYSLEAINTGRSEPLFAARDALRNWLDDDAALAKQEQSDG